MNSTDPDEWLKIVKSLLHLHPCKKLTLKICLQKFIEVKKEKILNSRHNVVRDFFIVLVILSNLRTCKNDKNILYSPFSLIYSPP